MGKDFRVSIKGTPRVCSSCDKLVSSDKCIDCPKCHRATYCSSKCQQDHLKLHKLQCKAAHAEQICDGCGVFGWSFMKCSRCKLARYCSKGCQAKHWTVHKEACLSATGGPSDSASNASDARGHQELDAFTSFRASSSEEIDRLLMRLLQKHSDKENQWVCIEADFQKLASEPKGKKWLKNRCRKMISSGDRAIAAEDEQRSWKARDLSGCRG